MNSLKNIKFPRKMKKWIGKTTHWRATNRIRKYGARLERFFNKLELE